MLEMFCPNAHPHFRYTNASVVAEYQQGHHTTLPSSERDPYYRKAGKLLTFTFSASQIIKQYLKFTV